MHREHMKVACSIFVGALNLLALSTSHFLLAALSSPPSVPVLFLPLHFVSSATIARAQNAVIMLHLRSVFFTVLRSSL